GAGSVASTSSLSMPCAFAPCASSAFRIAAPMPCAVPVTSAVLSRRSATRPAALDDIAHFLDARLPDAQDILIGSLVRAPERPVAEQFAHGYGVELPHLHDVRHRLSLLRLL